MLLPVVKQFKEESWIASWHLNISVIQNLHPQSHVPIETALCEQMPCSSDEWTKSCALFYEHGLSLIPAWISNYTHYNA